MLAMSLLTKDSVDLEPAVFPGLHLIYVDDKGVAEWISTWSCLLLRLEV